MLDIIPAGYVLLVEYQVAFGGVPNTKTVTLPTLRTTLFCA